MENILPITDMIGAKLATIAFIFMILKFVFLRTNFQRTSQFFQKIHRPLGFLLIIFAVIHGLSSLRAFDQVDLYVYMLGASSLILVIATICTHVFKQKLNENWLKWHRIFTVLTFIVLVLHLIFGFRAYFKL